MEIIQFDKYPEKIIQGKDININEDYYDILKQMEVLCDKYKGIGLSATQVNIPLNLFVGKICGKYRYFANYKYIKGKYSRKVYNIEGCLSLNWGQTKYKVPRWDMIDTEGYEYLGEKWKFIKQYKANESGFLIQHESDHNSGVLINKIC